MTLWRATDLISAVGGTVPAGPPGAVKGVSIDSRTLVPGDLFIALAGPNHDGHDHVAAALAAGASAALVSRIPAGLDGAAPLIRVGDTQAALEQLGRAARDRAEAQILAVTGSVGKTGTKAMLAKVLGDQGQTHAADGSLNNHWGVPLSLARLPADAQYGVFELGMNHAGEIAALTRQVRPHIAIITTVEPAHLEFFPDVAAIADAKGEIFQGMDQTGTAILNRDNPWFDRLSSLAKAAGLTRILSFGADPAADFRLIRVVTSGAGSRVEAQLQGHTVHYRLALPGRHQAMNSLAVLAAARAVGGDLAHAALSLGQVAPLAGRGKPQIVAAGNAGGTALLIDESYNASPAAVRAAIAVLAEMTPPAGGRRLLALGDMRELGERGPELHAGLAADILAAGIDQVFTCGPLMAELDRALPAARRGGWAADSAALAPLVAAALRPGDIITIKGSNGSRMAVVVRALTQGRG